MFFKFLKACDYRDIKLNVLISNDDESEQIIGEIQLVTKTMLIMKERGHALYGVVRRQQFVDTIKQMKIRKQELTLDDIIKRKDTKEFGNYLLHYNDNGDNVGGNNYDIYSPDLLYRC